MRSRSMIESGGQAGPSSDEAHSCSTPVAMPMRRRVGDKERETDMVKTGLMAAAAAAVCSMAGAEVIVFSQFDVWSSFVSAMGETVATETFSGYNGFYPGDVTGTVGGIGWTASASGGIFVEGGLFSTNTSDEEILFELASGVNGIGGNFFGTDVNFNVVPSVVEVFLGDGTTYIAFVDSASAFVGFYSTDVAITRISTLSLIPGSTTPIWATVDNLYVAVPAPGALALLATAGVLARRRRRD